MTKKELLKALDRIARSMQSKEAFIEAHKAIFEGEDVSRGFYPMAYGVLTTEIAMLAAEGDLLKACDIYDL